MQILEVAQVNAKMQVDTNSSWAAQIEAMTSLSELKMFKLQRRFYTYPKVLKLQFMNIQRQEYNERDLKENNRSTTVLPISDF